MVRDRHKAVQQEPEFIPNPNFRPPLPPIPPAPHPVQEKPAHKWIDEKKPKQRRFLNRYPIIAILLEPRAGGGTFAFFDRIGRFKKKIGLGFEYRLKKKKKKLPTSVFDNLIESNKARVLVLDHPEEDVFTPVQIDHLKITPKETAWKEIFMNNVERAQTLLMRRGFLEKYMPLVLLIVFGVLMIMALYVARMDFAQIYAQLQQVTASATSALSGATANPPL